MSQEKLIKELSEIIAEALAGRPDLQERLDGLLRIPPKKKTSKKAKSATQRRDEIKGMFTRLALKKNKNL